MKASNKNPSEMSVLWINLRGYFLIWLSYYMLRKMGNENISEIGEYISSLWGLLGIVVIFISSVYLSRHDSNSIKEAIKYNFIALWVILTIILFEIIVFI